MARRSKISFPLTVILVTILALFAYTFYKRYEGFRDVDCQGINCPEGQFCQSNKCHPIYPPSTNSV